MSLRSRLTILRRLSWEDRAVVARAAVGLPLIALALRLFRLASIQARLSTHFPPASTRPTRADHVCDLVAVVVDRHPYRGNCLERSLTLWWLLGREGLASEILFGVRPPGKDSTPAFHAWVERDGSPLNDRPDIATEFIPFDQPIGSLRGRLV